MAVWPENERILSRTSIFRCELLVSGRVTHQKEGFQKNWLNANWIPHSRKVPQKEKVTAWHFSWNKDKQKANPPVWYFLETLEPRLQPIVLECVSTIFTCLTPLSTFKVAPLRPNIQTTNYYRSFHQTGRIFPTFTLHLSLFFTRFFWQIFQAPPILDDLWNPRSWSVDPSTGTPRTTSVKKKKNEERWALKSPFFLKVEVSKCVDFFIICFH